uniref:Ferritin n=1 Tax=Cyprinus carpio TaxID=7962 RepID=A0A8C1Q1K6_CYPCA
MMSLFLVLPSSSRRTARRSASMLRSSWSSRTRGGGRIVLQDIKKPDRDMWGNGLIAMQCALQLEKNVNQALLDLHKVASEKGDPHVSDPRC